MSSTGNRPPPIQSLAEFLASIGRGELPAEAVSQLNEIAAALNQYVQDNGGQPKAKLTITVDFALKKGVTEITGRVEAKLPKHPGFGGIMWIDANNRFTQQHPNQLQMFPDKPHLAAAQ